MHSLLTSIVLFFIIGCKANNEASQEGLSDNTEGVSTELGQKDYDSSRFSNYELSELAKISEEHIVAIKLLGDTLSIVSGGSLIYSPFGVVPFKDSIQNNFGSIFQVSKSASNSKKLYKLTYKESYIEIEENDESQIPKRAEGLAEYRHQRPDLALILSASIKNQEISLNQKIKVGISKSDFFEVIFSGAYSASLDGVKVVTNVDPPGEHLKEAFFFKENVLVEIKIKSLQY